MRRKVFILVLAVLGAIGSLYGASGYSSAGINCDTSTKIVSSENALVSIPQDIQAGPVERGGTIEVPVQITNRLGQPVTDIDVIYKQDISGVGIIAERVPWLSSGEGIVMLKVTATNDALAEGKEKNSTLTFVVKWNGGYAKIESQIGVTVTEG